MNAGIYTTTTTTPPPRRGTGCFHPGSAAALFSSVSVTNSPENRNQGVRCTRCPCPPWKRMESKKVKRHTAIIEIKIQLTCPRQHPDMAK